MAEFYYCQRRPVCWQDAVSIPRLKPLLKSLLMKLIKNLKWNQMKRKAAQTRQKLAAGNEASLADIKSLVGMNDEDTAGLLGGGEENWSNNFYSISVQRTKHSIGKHR